MNGARNHVTGPVAGIARCPVQLAVVTLLAAFDDAVPTALDLTARRATVAGRRVAVVALLTRLDDVVATDRLLLARRESRIDDLLRGRRDDRARDHGRLARIPVLEPVGLPRRQG